MLGPYCYSSQLFQDHYYQNPTLQIKSCTLWDTDASPLPLPQKIES